MLDILSHNEQSCYHTLKLKLIKQKHTQLLAEHEFPNPDPAQVLAFPSPQMPSVEVEEVEGGIVGFPPNPPQLASPNAV
jgi:hypothetical protein